MAQIALPHASSCCDSFLPTAAHCNRSSSTRGCQVRALPVRNSFRNDGGRIPVKNLSRCEGGERTFSSIPVRNSWSNSSTNSRWVEGERRINLRLKRGGGAGRTERKRVMAARNMWGKVEAPKPTYVPLEPITGEEHFDQVLKEAQEKNQPIVIDWLAAWCRKCIYLKPKMEKLAAEFHPEIKFYVVDVNTVPQSLVKRAAVTKMPTIQLWKDGKWWAEVIGGHQAWLVLDEVRVMIGKREKD